MAATFPPTLPSADPMVQLTAEATTPDLGALAALDAYLASFGVGRDEAGDDPDARPWPRNDVRRQKRRQIGVAV